MPRRRKHHGEKSAQANQPSGAVPETKPEQTDAHTTNLDEPDAQVTQDVQQPAITESSTATTAEKEPEQDLDGKLRFAVPVTLDAAAESTDASVDGAMKAVTNTAEALDASQTAAPTQPSHSQHDSYDAHVTAEQMEIYPLQTEIPLTPAPSSAVIRFYSREDPYYEFTNFFYRPIEVDGKIWPTTEHYFQAQKFVNSPELMEQARLKKTARSVFTFARQHSSDIRLDWEAVKNDVMYRALQAKFTQHDDLQQLLLSTGQATLVEHTVNDRCWGDGGDGSGENRLGQLLEKVRSELAPTFQAPSLPVAGQDVKPSYHSASPGPKPAAFSGYPDAAQQAPQPQAQHVVTGYAADATVADMKSDPLRTPIPRSPLAESDVVKFYRKEDPYYEFTNFFYRPIELDGKVWPTTEHFFQAHKFVNNPELMEQARLLRTAREVFTFARQHWKEIRPDWEDVKTNIMYRALKAKFRQFEDLRSLLLATGNAKLVEHTKNDRVWADGGDGTGENRLGHLLERVRNEIRFQMFTPSPPLPAIPRAAIAAAVAVDEPTLGVAPPLTESVKDEVDAISRLAAQEQAAEQAVAQELAKESDRLATHVRDVARDAALFVAVSSGTDAVADVTVSTVQDGFAAHGEAVARTDTTSGTVEVASEGDAVDMGLTPADADRIVGSMLEAAEKTSFGPPKAVIGTVIAAAALGAAAVAFWLWRTRK